MDYRTKTEINHNAFMATCDAATAVWKRFGKTMRQRRESLSTNRYGWYVPLNCQKELEGDLLHVWYAETEYWLDLKTGYRHYQKPVLFQRGFVQLLKEGEMTISASMRRLRMYLSTVRMASDICGRVIIGVFILLHLALRTLSTTKAPEAGR